MPRARRLLTFLSSLCVTAVASAQQPSGVFLEPRWDPTDPASVAQKADFTVRWVAGLDAGDVRTAMDCFRFTTPVTSYLPYIFRDEVEVFSTIYDHRLSANYTFFNLITDDFKVRHSSVITSSPARSKRR